MKRTKKLDKASVLNNDFCVIGWTIAISDGNSNLVRRNSESKIHQDAIEILVNLKLNIRRFQEIFVNLFSDAIVFP